MSRKSETERTEAIAQLREWITPGDTVYTILDHVSRSGMSRAIRVVIPQLRDDGTIDHIHPNYAIGKALGLRHWRSNGREQDALVIGGCGMDMGFHLVYELSHALYGHGYACLGKGEDGRRCPSNYHSNHHSMIRCSGDCYRLEIHRTPEAYAANRTNHDSRRGSWIASPALRDQADLWTWTSEDGTRVEITRRYLAVRFEDEAHEIPILCETCKGTGEIPNPEGPERWDLVHTDGYALRHRWL